MTRSIAALLLLASVSPTPASAQLGSRDTIPVELPERPFLLVDAERRYVPSERAQVRVQLRDGGRLELAVFRVTRPDRLLGQAGARQGVSVSRSPLGREAEALLRRSSSFPRRGHGLDLVSTRSLAMPYPDGPARIFNEAVVYDSNEAVEDGVATYWVRGERWSVRDVDLGRLPTGLYLVQARGAAWVSSALLSVGELILLARRGDRFDLVRASGADGEPRSGVPVSLLRDGRQVATEITGPDGVARFASSPGSVVRYRAEVGRDLAWTDVAHVALAACDPRVYLATGRPLYRRSETIYLRGHARGCNEAGEYGPLAQETISVGDVTAVTDPDGNFVAQVPATGQVVAELRGRRHERAVRIDDRALPRRAIFISTDRPSAVVGQVVTVRVADEDGGWPSQAEVLLETPSGRMVAPIGPGAPAVFHVPIRATDEPVERFGLFASLSGAHRTTMAHAEIWTGRSPVQLSLEAEAQRGEEGQAFPIRVTAHDLLGQPSAGTVTVTVRGSDGNRSSTEVRRRRELALSSDGSARARILLEGAGPWTVRAEQGGAQSQITVWATERPPALARRGPLTVRPRQSRVQPGEDLAVNVRLPRGPGRAWLTLEQGDVLHSELITRAAGSSQIVIPVTEAMRGSATLVLTHMARGRVSTASATVEVSTSRPMTTLLSTAQATYPRGATARVRIEAKNEDGTPRDAVVSLWLADAGYWELGEDDYPLPGDYLRLPGRRTSGGDSATPLGYGAEEGRALDSELTWDGRALSSSTHRHGWGFGGEVIDVTRRGSLDEVLRALARAAGFPRAEQTCEAAAASPHRLHVRGLPWDLVALRVADAIGAEAIAMEDRLLFECMSGGSGGLGMAGRGAGVPSIRAGMASLGGNIREERLEGTLHFVGLSRLGPDGEVELDVPLPDHPGRWRIEVLAIADDGDGARAHRVVHTEQPLRGWVDLPSWVHRGDTVRGRIHVHGGASPNADVSLRLTTPEGLTLTEAPPTRATLDADGRLSVPFEVRAVDEGAHPVTLSVRGAGESDAVRVPLRVRPSTSRHALRLTTALGPGATDLEVPLPELARATRVSVSLPRSPAHEAAEVLELLRRPRWDFSVSRVDRLEALSALRRVVRAEDGSFARLLAAEVELATQAEAHAVAGLTMENGELGWGTLPDETLTLRAIAATPSDLRGTLFSTALERMEARVTANELHGVSAALAAYLVADAARAETLLERALREAQGELGALSWIVRAADRHQLRALQGRAATQLARGLGRRLDRPIAACRTQVWFACLHRPSAQGLLARAATTLVDVDHPGAEALASRVGERLSRQPPTDASWLAGSDEADLLELFNALQTDRSAEPYTVLVDGRALRARGRSFTVPAGAHRVRLRFSARPGRLRRLRLSADADLVPPGRAVGNVRLERRFSHDGAGYRAAVSFHLDRAEDVLLRVPLPAGLTLDQRRLGRRAILEAGVVQLPAARLAAGSHTVELPLLVTGNGTFGVGSAELRTDRGSTFGITPATSVDVAP